MQSNNKLYLVALALGPVQDFIAAARRTRDLWFGSFLLSEISKRAARYLRENCGADSRAGLIFPATDNPEEDLKPCVTNLDDTGNPPFNVPNKILAVIETDNPKNVLDRAKMAAQERWEELANAIFKKKQKWRLKKEDIDNEIWIAQLEDLLELFAAWVEYDPNKDEYDVNRARLEQLLAARKNSRNFGPSKVNGDRIPKSSLDGLRESVVADDRKLKGQKKLSLGLSAGEQLDCPGLVKRLGGDPEQFTPLSRIAVDPWLRSLKESGIELPTDAISIFKKIHKAEYGLVSKVHGHDDEEFSFDGQLLYPFRIAAESAQIDNLLKKNEISVDAHKQVSGLLRDLKEEIEQLIRLHGEPSPYVAILAADGDSMGKLINAAENEGQHRDISKILSDFAKGTAEIINHHFGQLIYAGGDDVLAIVPLDRMLICANDLADGFAKLWQKLREKDINFQKINPTLSVGIGINHMMTPIGKQLDLAREAEQLAKNNQDSDKGKRKNGLAIIYQPRSGDRIEFREQWSATPERANEILEQWRRLHVSRELPFRAAFQLRILGRAIGDWCGPGHDLLEKEIGRILDRKRIKKNEKVGPEVIDSVCKRGEKIGLGKLADELILTQKLAKHTTFKVTKEEKETGRA